MPQPASTEIAEVVIPGETGVLFRTGNRDSLIEALLKAADLGQEERSRMGTRSRELWEQRYTVERLLSGYAAVYEKLRRVQI